MRRISVAFPCLSSDWLRHIELHHWLSTTFLQGGRYFLLLIFEDINNMYQQYFAEITINPPWILPQRASVDGTADMYCFLIDQHKNRNLATTISCYDHLSCKSWSFDRGDQLLPYFYYIGKYFEAGQSQPCYFELWHNDELSWRAFLHQMRLATVTSLLPFHRTNVRLLFLSVATSEVPLSSFSISFIGCKGVFWRRLILIVLVAAMPFPFQMRSRFGLVKTLSIMMW